MLYPTGPAARIFIIRSPPRHGIPTPPDHLRLGRKSSIIGALFQLWFSRVRASSLFLRKNEPGIARSPPPIRPRGQCRGSHHPPHSSPRLRHIDISLLPDHLRDREFLFVFFSPLELSYRAPPRLCGGIPSRPWRVPSESGPFISFCAPDPYVRLVELRCASGGSFPFTVRACLRRTFSATPPTPWPAT